jgi:hypothetical protein
MRAFLAVLLSTVAAAATEMPPGQYDHVPNMPIADHVVSFAEVQKSAVK